MFTLDIQVPMTLHCILMYLDKDVLNMILLWNREVIQSNMAAILMHGVRKRQRSMEAASTLLLAGGRLGQKILGPTCLMDVNQMNSMQACSDGSFPSVKVRFWGLQCNFFWVRDQMVALDPLGVLFIDSSANISKIDWELANLPMNLGVSRHKNIGTQWISPWYPAPVRSLSAELLQRALGPTRGVPPPANSTDALPRLVGPLQQRWGMLSFRFL